MLLFAKLHLSYPHLISCKEGVSTPGQIRTLGQGGQFAGLVQAEQRVAFHGRFLAPAAAPLQAVPLAAPTLLTLIPRQPFLPQGPRAKGTPLPIQLLPSGIAGPADPGPLAEAEDGSQHLPKCPSSGLKFSLFL